MYTVKTKFGVTYNYVQGFKKWSVDDRFLVFEWGRDGKGTFIIKIDDIQSIETN